MKNKKEKVKSRLLSGKILKLFTSLCILNFVFCIYSNAQIQQNNIRIVDTVYTPPGYAGGALTSILWLPSITNGAAIILIHTAGGTQEEDKSYGDFFSSYGYVVISMDYYGFFHPSGNPAIYPAPVKAVKTAVEFLRKNALTFGCYSGKVAAIGFSEGAMTLGQTIIWDNDDAYFNTDHTINDHLDAAICYYGLYDNLNHLESPFFSNEGNDATIAEYFALNPALRATKGNPVANITNITTPVLLIHGTSDQVWNFEQSIEFNDSLIARGKTCVLKLLTGSDHIFDYQGTISPRLNLHPNHMTTIGIIERDTVLGFIGRSLQVNNIHCPYGKAYWKNHTTLWNSDAIPMKLGTTNYYNKTQLLAILNSSSGDVSIKLAQDLISVKLNLANNSYAVPIASNIIAADNLIGARAIPVVPVINSNSEEGIQMTSFGNIFQAYNNGSMTPNCNNSSRFSALNQSGNLSVDILPDPVSGSTRISFTLQQAQNISVNIYDISGRLVKSLVSSMMQEGNHQVNWDASNEKGNAVKPGIYFLKFDAGDYSQTRKILVNK